MFQRLAIAAPPHLLGAIRDRLDDDLKRRLLVSVPKRLTSEPLGRIGNLMQYAMYPAA
jgi:protein required for attachment to host cells